MVSRVFTHCYEISDIMTGQTTKLASDYVNPFSLEEQLSSCIREQGYNLPFNLDPFVFLLA